MGIDVSVRFWKQQWDHKMYINQSSATFERMVRGVELPGERWKLPTFRQGTLKSMRPPSIVQYRFTQKLFLLMRRTGHLWISVVGMFERLTPFDFLSESP